MKALLIYRCRLCGAKFETDLSRKMGNGFSNAEILSEMNASEIPQHPSVAIHAHACDMQGTIGCAEILGLRLPQEN